MVPAVIAGLNADILIALIQEILNLFIQLLIVGAGGVAVDRHGLAHFAAPKLPNRHVRRLADNIPQGHITARNRVVEHRAVAPIGGVHHVLPGVVHVQGVMADEQLAHVVVDNRENRGESLGIGGASIAIQPGLIGVNAHDNQVGALGRGGDGAHRGNLDVGHGKISSSISRSSHGALMS